MPRLKEILEKYGPSSTQLVKQTLLAHFTLTPNSRAKSVTVNPFHCTASIIWILAHPFPFKISSLGKVGV